MGPDYGAFLFSYLLRMILIINGTYVLLIRIRIENDSQY